MELKLLSCAWFANLILFTTSIFLYNIYNSAGYEHGADTFGVIAIVSGMVKMLLACCIAICIFNNRKSVAVTPFNDESMVETNEDYIKILALDGGLISEMKREILKLKAEKNQIHLKYNEQLKINQELSK